MPRLAVLLVRAALCHLALGVAAGALLLAHKGAPLHPAVAALAPVHVESLLLGWTVQLAMGVAYWILPRHPTGAPRGREAPVWLAFGLLNAGVLGVGLTRALGGPEAIAVAGRLLEALAAALFAAHAWPRVRATVATR
ncbi:MAG TPA: hypothetical protein VNK43_07530 [Gemmatimonadales bacterium]|nr:hypothetical protein [Gemmatimonadales bacterium]